MGASFPIRNIGAALAGTIALSLLASGSVRAQTPASGGSRSGDTAKSGDAPKSGETPKSGDGAKAAENEALDKLKDVKITLDADRENLLNTLRNLMKGAKADFLIDDALKAGTATVHFKDLPFKDALNTLVKVSTFPIAYEVKDGIFHFMRRPEPPPTEEKPADPAAPVRPRFQTGHFPLDQVGSGAALRRLTGPYDSQPPIIYQRSTLPGSHGSTSSFGLSGSGLLNSNNTRINPDGSVSRSGAPPLNILGLLRGLLGGLR